MPKRTWKRATFKIAVNPDSWNAESDSGERKGLVRGPFGIHYEKSEDQWVLTHLKSGYKAAKCVTQALAKKKADAFEATDADWSQENPIRTMTTETKLICARINEALTVVTT